MSQVEQTKKLKTKNRCSVIVIYGTSVLDGI
jgi:hypothetical protein